MPNILKALCQEDKGYFFICQFKKLAVFTAKKAFCQIKYFLDKRKEV